MKTSTKRTVTRYLISAIVLSGALAGSWYTFRDARVIYRFEVTNASPAQDIAEGAARQSLAVADITPAPQKSIKVIKTFGDLARDPDFVSQTKPITKHKQPVR